MRSTPRAGAVWTADEGSTVGEVFVLGEPASSYDVDWAEVLHRITHEFFADRDRDRPLGRTLAKLAGVIVAITGAALVVLAALVSATVVLLRAVLG